MGSLRLKLNEKEEIVKGLTENIEKYKNKIKILKEESSKAKVKEITENTKEQEQEKPVQNNIELKKIIENEQIPKKPSKIKKLETPNELQKTHIYDMYFNLTMNVLIPNPFTNFSLLSILICFLFLA